jgi:hypothetical protein
VSITHLKFSAWKKFRIHAFVYPDNLFAYVEYLGDNAFDFPEFYRLFVVNVLVFLDY